MTPLTDASSSASTPDSITREPESIVALQEADSWASSILFTYIGRATYQFRQNGAFPGGLTGTGLLRPNESLPSLGIRCRARLRVRKRPSTSLRLPRASMRCVFGYSAALHIPPGRAAASQYRSSDFEVVGDAAASLSTGTVLKPSSSQWRVGEQGTQMVIPDRRLSN